MEVTAEQATCYLRENAAAHRALGISPDAALSIVAEPLAQGEHNANFVFAMPGTAKKYVMRVNYVSQLGLQDQIGYEYKALCVLEPSGCTPKPVFVDSSKEFYGHGVMIIQFCDGALLDFGKPHDVSCAAHMLADVHSVKADDGCGLFHPNDPLRAQYDECIAYVRSYRRSSLQTDLVNRYLDVFMKKAQEVLEVPCDPRDTYHILNTEAVPSHFVISPHKYPGYFLDWEKPILGEVAQDVAYFLSPTTTIWDAAFIFPERQREEFLAEYWKAVDGRFPPGRFDERFEAYVVMNCLRGVTWCCQAWVEYHDPNRALKNELTFELMKLYLSEDYLEFVRRQHF